MTRSFFHASGAYFWSRSPEGELVGAEADGEQAQSFRGNRDDVTIAVEAVQRRRPFFVNHIDPARYPWLAKCHARATMAAPLLVS